MAWTAPTTRTTGDLITAAIWNTDLVDNLSILKAPISGNSQIDEGANYTTTSTSFVDIDATDLSKTLITNGGDVMVHFHGNWVNSGAGAQYMDIAVDGVRVGGTFGIIFGGGTTILPFSFTRLITGLSAASHVIKLQYAAASGTMTVYAGVSPDTHSQYWVREVS